MIGVAVAAKTVSKKQEMAAVSRHYKLERFLVRPQRDSQLPGQLSAPQLKNNATTSAYKEGRGIADQENIEGRKS
jgi:hypothetical protein